MENKITYTFTQYEPKSLDKEEFTVYGRTLEQVQQEIQEALKNNKSFRVAVFGAEDEVEDEGDTEGGYVQCIIKDLYANEVEDIIENNFGTSCEWLDGSDDTGNRYSIKYDSRATLSCCFDKLDDEGADVEII